MMQEKLPRLLPSSTHTAFSSALLKSAVRLSPKERPSSVFPTSEAQFQKVLRGG